MFGPSPRWIRTVAVAVALVLAALLAVVAGANVALNVAVHRLMNQHPERLAVRYTWAWTWFPGQVEVHGLEIAVGTPDPWVLTADRARGDISLGELVHRRFVARDLRASGVTFHLRPRPASEPRPPRARAPWTIALEDVVIEDLREVALADHGFAGRARVEGDLGVARTVELDARAVIGGGDLARGGDVLARDVTGAARILVSGLDPTTPLTGASLATVSGRATIGGRTEDLGRVVSPALARAPWLGIRGAATLAADVALDQGRLGPGSWLTAETTGLGVRLGELEARGDGRLRLAVEGDAGEALTHLSVHYGAFTIADGARDPLVVGTGLEVAGVSPDTDPLRPLETLEVTFDLPSSTLPDVARFDRYLPANAGLSLLGGSGEVRGRLVASAEGARATGSAVLDARDVRLGVGDVRITTDLAVHGALAEGHLGQGRYDFSGTRLSVTDLVVEDPTRRDATGSWWAELEVGRGKVDLGARDRVDATVALTCANALPILQVVAEVTSLPEWVRDRLPRVPGLEGSARVRLGADRVTVDPLAVRGRGAELQLRWLQGPSGGLGEVLARLYALTLALEVTPAGTSVRPFDARRWFTRPRAAPFGAAAEGTERACDTTRGRCRPDRGEASATAWDTSSER